MALLFNNIVLFIEGCVPAVTQQHGQRQIGRGIAVWASLPALKRLLRGEAHRLVRLLIPALLPLRQLDGIVPEKRFWLALSVCS